MDSEGGSVSEGIGKPAPNPLPRVERGKVGNISENPHIICPCGSHLPYWGEDLGGGWDWGYSWLPKTDKLL